MSERRSGERVVGVVSDTHGLLRPEVLLALSGVDQIIHAGDVGAPEVLEVLAGLGPLVAIRGNNDTAPWAARLRERELLEVDGVRILVLHDRKELRGEEGTLAPSVVVSGHSHKPSIEERRGVLFFNPGSAGPRRFRLPITVGKLWVHEGRARGQIVTLGG